MDIETYDVNTGAKIINHGRLYGSIPLVGEFSGDFTNVRFQL